MPRQTVRSGLAAKLGEAAKEAFYSHREDETSYGMGGDLPAGIEGGTAELIEAKFDTFKSGTNEGEYYFLAAGVVVEPEVYNGMHIRGRRTQIGPEPVCKTPGRSRQTVDDHYQWVLNELRKLGVPTDEIEFDDLEPTVVALKEAAPRFRFRTWQGNATPQFPTPRVNHEWKGLIDYEPDTEPAGGEVDDQTSDNEPPETQTQPLEPASQDAELIELAKAADAGDEGAAVRIAEDGEAVGVDTSPFDSWADAARAVIEASSGEPAAEGPEPASEVNTPEKGDVLWHKPKGARKRLEAEVTAVFVGKQVCNLRLLDDNRLIKAVPWDKLEWK